MKPNIQILVFGLLLIAATGLCAQESPRIIHIINPAQSIGVHIGDVLNRKIELAIPAPYQLSKTALPSKGTQTDGLELVDLKLSSSQDSNDTRYQLDLYYQVFAHSSSPTVMQLPAEHLALTGGAKAPTFNIPVWRFWFSPLVAGRINMAKESLQPQHRPSLVDISPHQTRLAIFLGLLTTGLIGLLYVNADRTWLPFMGGAFAQAHRQLKRLHSTTADEKQALFVLHRAFNQVHGSNLFAQDIDTFLAAHPGFAKLKDDITSFFEHSNQSLFSTSPHDSIDRLPDLLTLSKNLRDCERGL